MYILWIQGELEKAGVGEIIILLEIRENVLFSENRREGHQKLNFGRWKSNENRNNFFGKRSNWEKISRSLKFFSEIGGNLKQRGMHHCLRGGWTPLNTHGYIKFYEDLQTGFIILNVCSCSVAGPWGRWTTVTAPGSTTRGKRMECLCPLPAAVSGTMIHRGWTFRMRTSVR